MAGEHVATINNGASSAAVEQRFRRGATVNQNVCVFAMETPPPSAKPLCELITQFRICKTADGRLSQIKTLHFLSMTVFEDQHFDPTFVLEANFDGPAGPFWADLEVAIGPRLREILRYGKRPNDPIGNKFDVVTAAGSQAPVAPLLEALAVKPTAVHQGDRGTSAEQIKQDSQLFEDVQTALRDPSPFRGKSATEIHRALRDRLIRGQTSLNVPPPLTLPALGGDAVRLLFAIALLILSLNVPGVLLTGIISLFAGNSAPLWATIILVVAIAAFIWRLRHALSDLASDVRAPGKTEAFQVGALVAPLGALAIAELLLVVILVFLRLGFDFLERVRAAVDAKAPISGTLFDQLKLVPAAFWALLDQIKLSAAALWAVLHGQSIFHYVLPDYIRAGIPFAWVGFLGAVVTALYILRGLRVLERQDSSQHQPDVGGLAERKIAAFEDHGEQNHMSGLVHIRPGSLRSNLMRAGLKGLGLAIRTDPTAALHGYLITVRTIHFAHLTLISNGSRLLFLANFDGTWNNYLVDFIEKVHTWLTLVWTNGLGFPPTRFFVFKGATHGRLFTNWQRQSMAPTLYWFRAYPNLSVEQIRRQGRIANGLRKASLKPREARTWAMDL